MTLRFSFLNSHLFRILNPDGFKRKQGKSSNSCWSAKAKLGLYCQQDILRPSAKVRQLPPIGGAITEKRLIVKFVQWLYSIKEVEFVVSFFFLCCMYYVLDLPNLCFFALSFPTSSTCSGTLFWNLVQSGLVFVSWTTFNAVKCGLLV